MLLLMSCLCSIADLYTYSLLNILDDGQDH